MGKLDDVFEAHVKFESARWQGDALRDSVNEEVAALFDWLAGVQLAAVLPESAARGVVRTAINSFDVSDTVVAIVNASIQSAHESALADETLVGDLLDPAAYDKAAISAIRLKALRAAITEQVTTSEVYSKLMSHVMYQGIKNYLQTENVIAKKVPGASRLMKVSQSAINTAAPKLEKAIDKQLTAFVNANIADSIRDSQQFLDKVLDEKVLRAVADEFWDTNAKVAVGDYAALVPIGATDAFVEVARDMWNHLRATDSFGHFVDSIVTDFYRRHGKRKVGELLAEVSITPDVVIDLTEPLMPALAKASTDGYFEERIRARLGAFYESYSG